MSDDMLPLDDLKAMLQIKDIESDMDDDVLSNLLMYKVNELSGLIGVDLLPTERELINPRFKSNKIFLNFYPVCAITGISIDSNILTEEDYVLNKTIGVIYLNKLCKGLLSVNYITKISDADFNKIVKPLLVDMVIYDLLNRGKRINEGVMSSIKEMDVTVSYDTSSSLGNRIYMRIDDLKSRYSVSRAKAKLL